MFLSILPELVQQLHCCVGPRCCRLAQVRRDTSLSFGGLPSFHLNQRYFRPKESCFDVPGIFSQHCVPPGSKVHLWQSPHAGGRGTAAHLLSLGVVRFRLWNHDHVEGTWDTACDSAPPQPSVPAKQREALLALKLFAVVVRDHPIERPHLLHLQEPRQHPAVGITGRLAPCLEVRQDSLEVNRGIWSSRAASRCHHCHRCGILT